MRGGSKKVKDKEIYTRIDKFALDVLKVVRKLPKDLITIEISRQLIRSATSVGANAREAQAAQTKKEFIRCFSICKREANETRYWIWILMNLDKNMGRELDFLIKENDELIAIISRIILTSLKRSNS